MAGSFWLPAERDYRDLNPLEAGQVMTARKLFIFIVLALFSLGLASPGLSGVVGEEGRDTATKIDGGRVNIKD
jgi:hypothetical protein